MLFFKNKLSKYDKLNFLEYLSFQTKDNMSVESILNRYITSGHRKKFVEDKCLDAISMIRNGIDKAEALLQCGFIEKFEYGIIKNSSSNEDLYLGLVSLININKNNIKNSDALASELRACLIVLSLIFLFIPFMQEDLIAMYKSFGDMQSMTGNGTTKVVEIPFLIKYWWSSFVFLAILIFIGMGIKLLLKYIYINHGGFYYKFFKNKLYMDLISVLKTFYQLKQTLRSETNAYMVLATSSPNKYWEELFEEITINQKRGEKASEIFVSQEGIIPLEVIECFIDAEDTGESDAYVNKAIRYCEAENEKINDMIRVWAPKVMDTLLYFLAGLLLVAFLKDIMQNSVLDVLSGINNPR